jgi:hypothetical protein
VQVDDVAVQRAADAHRRAKGLLDPEAARSWLHERGISLRQFTAMAEFAAQLRALRHRVAQGRVEEWFGAHGSRFDVLVLGWVGDAAGAVLEAACAAGDPLRAVHAELDAGRPAGVVHRAAHVAPQALQDAGPGVVTVVELGDGPVAAAVFDRQPAVLDDVVRDRIEDLLFEQWLAGLRSEAEIEWFWLDIARTGGLR